MAKTFGSFIVIGLTAMSQSKIRNTLFCVFMGLFVLIMAPIEYYDLYDSAIILYVVSLTFIGMCAALWVYWWFKSVKRPSAMFLVIGTLFVCIGYSISWQLFLRSLLLNHPDSYMYWANSNLWAYRVFPEMVLFVWLFCWVIGRFYGRQIMTEESPLADLDERFVFFRAQGIFKNETQIFRDAQEVFQEAQIALARAQDVFAKAQIVFSQAQRIFDRPS